MGTIAEQSISHKYVQKVADMPELQHGAVRVGLWLAAVAERTGGFPVEIFYTHLISGYHKDGIDVPGIAFRPPTVQKSLSALQELGLLTIEDGASTVHGHVSKLCTLNLE
jgi:hypothetical protein